jgi:hypothetical protein
MGIARERRCGAGIDALMTEDLAGDRARLVSATLHGHLEAATGTSAASFARLTRARCDR